MDHGFRPHPITIDDLRAALSRLPGMASAEAAGWIRKALETAAADSTTAEDSRILDDAVLSAWTGSRSIDEILGEIEPVRAAELLERVTALAAGEDLASMDARRRIWRALDLVRRPTLLTRIESSEIEAWSRRILAAIEASDMTVGPLFRRRAALYGSKVLFQIPRHGGYHNMTWRSTAARVERLSRGILALEPDGDPAPVGILSENRIEMALTDLACLGAGLVNVLVPANSTETDVGFILRHSNVRTVFVSGPHQLRKVLKNRKNLPNLKHIVSFETQAERNQPVIPLGALIAGAEGVPAGVPERRSDAVRVGDLATVMYTSGTTGTPKGIQFSHRNLVFKRFARALALPKIGDQDVFVCFLPLFHTFGRFLEMLGCVFWGARYCFLEGTSVPALLRGMRTCRPSVFISVPKKWMQLHAAITQEADPLKATDEQLFEATQRATGGNLRFGLSAAGHLDPDIFRMFQRNGVMLLSGFGMTEATGGITMTPPGEYKDESLGRALPGIEIKLAEDSELLVRGPYVMMGYLDPPDGEVSYDAEGWFHSGDLMEMDEDSHIRLIDRKKEIYKNIKGETIAPQRIENQFRDFESVGRAFLVGDHREYNTLLIHPNPSYDELDFDSMSSEDVWDHFRSLVVSVNKFLAPFERIVDFAVIDRDLDPERGELTAKGTPRRQVVARNFNDTIRLLYRRAMLEVGGVELVFPNWLFQALGLTAQDIRVEGDRLSLPPLGRRITVRAEDGGLTRIGSCLYRHENPHLNLGALLNAPHLWLGNEELVGFVTPDITERQRPGRNPEGIEWVGRAEPYTRAPGDSEVLSEAAGKDRWGLNDIDFAARALASSDETLALAAVQLLGRILSRVKGPLVDSASLVLSRAADHARDTVRRAAFVALVPYEKDARFPRTLRRFLRKHPDLLDSGVRSSLCELNLTDPKLEAFVGLAKVLCLDTATGSVRAATSLLCLLSDYGAGHPSRYRRLRAFLVRVSVFAARAEIREQAASATEAVLNGFRRWLGGNARLAVDPETGQEYRWDDVVVFHEGVPTDDRKRLLGAIKGTALLREGAFLFSRGVLIRLSDVPPGGVWIRPLGARHGKAVYRITIQTRFQGHHDLAVNVNHTLTPEQVSEEIQWLVLGGDTGNRATLVEDFGGYWPAEDLWSEEFIAGETLARALKRLAGRGGDRERLRQLWPFLAWTALSAYVDFWDRSGKRWEIADASMTNVIVPTDDFHTGVRIVSVSARRPHASLSGMMRAIMKEFIEPAERQYRVIEGLVGWDIVFSSILEVVGEDDGLSLLREALRSGDATDGDEMLPALAEYISKVEVRGFLSRRLFFGAKRYRRWARLSGDATPQARARTMSELYETYGLSRLTKEYPEARVRFFRETVFRDSPPALAEGLEALITGIRRGELVGDEFIDAIADLRSKLKLGGDDDYFLARLSLPYLRPEDAAGFVSSTSGGQQQSEIVVRIEDHDGNPFRVRHALNPKEVGRLHQLFLAAKLDVRFLPEHKYLVAINDRGHIVAGIYYEIEEGGESAHLEKIVVTDGLRGKGVADALMTEFFNRLRAAGVKAVTTGFFRPEYFYSYGFRIERRYAGLVKSLEDDGSSADPLPETPDAFP